MKKIISPFQLFIQELRKDYVFRKTLEKKKMKSILLGAMGQTCIALIGLAFMYYYAIYVIGAIIYTVINSTFEPLGLIGVPILPLMIWCWTSLCIKIFIKNKIEYFKQENLYEQYKDVTQHI